MSKTKFKDNCSRCAKAWNCFSRDNCDFVEMSFDNAFDDDMERSFQNIGLDGSPGNSWNNSWNKEDDEENNLYLSYCSSL